MREIKFRVWSGNQMAYIPSIEFEQISNYLMRNGCYDVGLKRVFQQFTGLKDKNGREIYEGDIIQVLDENNVFEVKFGKVKRDIVGFDTFTVYPVELNAFYFEQEGRPYFSITNNHLGKHDLENTEIIGNIFENPEILE